MSLKESGVRQSSRATKGTPARRYSDSDFNKIADIPTEHNAVSENGRRSNSAYCAVNRPNSNSCSGSEILRRKLEAKLKAEEELMAIEDEFDQDQEKLAQELALKRKERRKQLIQTRLSFEEAKIDEEADVEQFDVVDKELRALENGMEQGEEDNRKIEDWVNKSQLEVPNDILVEESKGGIPALAQAIMQAIQTVQTSTAPKPQQGEKMDRFLVRQTMGKELPTFTGEPEDWPGFIEEYKRTTEACGFSDVENLSRLRKCLKGKAKDAVQGMMIVPNNVSEVIQTLQTRFGRPSLIIQTLIDKARKTCSPREDDLETIMEYGNVVRNLVTTMETLKSKGHLGNPQLLQELAGKIPANLRLDWGRHSKQIENAGSETTLKDFSSWLNIQVEAVGMVSVPKFRYEERVKTTTKRNDFRNRPKETVLATTDSKRRIPLQIL